MYIEGLEKEIGENAVAVLVGMDWVAAPEVSLVFVLLPVLGVIDERQLVGAGNVADFLHVVIDMRFMGSGHACADGAGGLEDQMAVDLSHAVGEGVEIGFKLIDALVKHTAAVVHANHDERDVGLEGCDPPVKGVQDAAAGIAIDSGVNDHVHFSIQLIADALGEQFGVIACAPGVDHAMGDTVTVKEPADGLVAFEKSFDSVHEGHDSD